MLPFSGVFWFLKPPPESGCASTGRCPPPLSDCCCVLKVVETWSPLPLWFLGDATILFMNKLIEGSSISGFCCIGVGKCPAERILMSAYIELLQLWLPFWLKLDSHATNLFANMSADGVNGCSCTLLILWEAALCWLGRMLGYCT